MASEHEFIRLRLDRVERQLKRPESAVIYEGHGRGRRRTSADVDNRQDNLYKREARLLRHILTHTREGQVRHALRGWRDKFGRFLTDHRERYRAMQDAYDTWWSLPVGHREVTLKPPRPPLARYTDQSGDEWIIDDKFLIILDDISDRLDKWLYEA